MKKVNKKNKPSEKNSIEAPKRVPTNPKRKKKPSILDEFDEFGDIDFDIPEPIDGVYDDDEDDDLY